jgi:hypothetical protein
MAEVEVIDRELLTDQVRQVDPDLVKALVALLDGDGWQMADLLVENFPVDEYGETANGRNTELYSALEATEDTLRREYGVELTVATMRRYRATAIAWPAVARATAASFAAHQKLCGDDRFDRMARYLKRNKDRPLSKRDVQRYRADDNPTPVKPWDIRAKRRIESTVKSLLLGGIVTKREDWWNIPGVDESRDALIKMLFDLGTRMGEQ